ncbi:alpha-amylase/4-alpha-glucanotransferase domain-containing protein, partial [Thermovibrio sp.]
VGDFANQPYELKSLNENRLVIERKGGIYIDGIKFPTTLKKTFTFKNSKLKVVVELESKYQKELTLAAEVNLHFQNPKPKIEENGKKVEVEDENLKVLISHQGEKVIYFPIETVHQVENGVESTVQGTSFLILQKLKDGKFKTEISLEVRNV